MSPPNPFLPEVVSMRYSFPVMGEKIPSTASTVEGISFLGLENTQRKWLVKLEGSRASEVLVVTLKQWYSAFLVFQPFNIAHHGVVITSHRTIFTATS